MEDRKYIQNQFDNKNRIAVLVVNFGGPHNLKSVTPFLYNLFSDPTVLNFPFTPILSSLLRSPLAWLISNIRSKTSCKMYKKTGSISPLISITYLQAQKLQKLFEINDLPINVFLGFRYSHPFIEKVLDEIKEKGYKKIIVLPLYPQYSYTTTGSVELVINKWMKKNDIKIHLIKQWHTDEDYIQAYTDLIQKVLKNMDLRSTEIIFSAHSIPLINIKNKDPYQKQTTETVTLILERLNWKKRWHIGYQSKIGPVKWLEPFTDKVIEEIAQRSKNAQILVVPISFVCEHVETIFEIGKLYKGLATGCGIKKFMRVPALNTNKYLIQALYNQIINCLENNKLSIRELLVVK